MDMDGAMELGGPEPAVRPDLTKRDFTMRRLAGLICLVLIPAVSEAGGRCLPRRCCPPRQCCQPCYTFSPCGRVPVATCPQWYRESWAGEPGHAPPAVAESSQLSPRSHTTAYLSANRFLCPQYYMMCSQNSCLWMVREYAYDASAQTCTAFSSGMQSYPMSQDPGTCTDGTGCTNCEPLDLSVSFQEAESQAAATKLDLPLAARDSLPAAGDDLGEKGFEFPLADRRNALIKQSSTEPWGRYIVRHGRTGPWLRLFVARFQLTNGRTDRVPLGYEFSETKGTAENAVIESVSRVPIRSGGEVGHLYAVKLRGIDTPYWVRTATELLR